MKASHPVVAEIQGLYGPFSFPEKLLQKIWLRGDFNRAAARTVDGRRVRIVHPGKWNLLGGPDFKGARLSLEGGPEFVGDVELHLRAADWEAHRHASDPAYDGVVLHVVLFPPDGAVVTRGAGREIPLLALLPLLHHDLEEFAADDAVEVMAGRSSARMAEELASLSQDALAALLRRHAVKRWQQKVHFARIRVQRLGWEEACHHTALEILGYRFNRAPMLQVATRWPLKQWEKGAVAPETVFGEVKADSGWSLHGVRPANHPRLRLTQYAAWVRARPDWPARLRELGRSFPRLEPTESTRDQRRRHRLTQWRSELSTELCADIWGGTRLDTLACDGFWPLVAAIDGQGDGNGLEGLWVHWFVGDLPPALKRGLVELGVADGPGRPLAQGVAQGLLGWLWEREARR